MRLVASASLLLLGACVEVPPAVCTETSDYDGDGWTCARRLPDCDDGDETRNPGELDDCETTVDEDCSGAAVACPDTLAGFESNTDDEAPVWGVHGGGISAQFHEGQQWTLASITSQIDNEELLSRVDGSNTEQYVGVELYPAFDQFYVSSALPAVLEVGRAYVKIAVNWQNDTVGEVARGVSTFGFFPNGVIHRHERFEIVEQVTATDRFLVTHWSLDGSKYSHITSRFGADNDLTPTGVVQAPHVNSGTNDTGVICVYDATSGRRATMAWRVSPGAAGSRAILGEELPAPRLALNYDWIRASTAPLDPGVWNSITAMAFDEIDTGQACASAGSLENELNPIGLTIEEGAPGERSEANGYIPDEGVFEIEAAEGARYVEATVGATMPRGLMLRVGIDASFGVSVWRDGVVQRAFEDYLIQETDEGVTVFFPDRLDADEIVRVARPGGEP